MDRSVDKGNGLAWIQSRFGILPEETMAFGDNTNDIGLMKAAYYSYAVENARPEVKEAARFSCPSYEQKGVLQAICGNGGNRYSSLRAIRKAALRALRCFAAAFDAGASTTSAWFWRTSEL